MAATFTVKGTSGQEDPFVTATCSVIGADLDGAAQTWAAAEPYTLDAGATVADLAEALFAETGMTADFGIRYARMLHEWSQACRDQLDTLQEGK